MIAAADPLNAKTAAVCGKFLPNYKNMVSHYFLYFLMAFIIWKDIFPL